MYLKKNFALPAFIPHCQISELVPFGEWFYDPTTFSRSYNQVRPLRNTPGPKPCRETVLTLDLLPQYSCYARSKPFWEVAPREAKMRRKDISFSTSNSRLL